MTDEIDLSQLEDPRWLRLEVAGARMSPRQLEAVEDLEEMLQWKGESERLEPE